MLATETRRPDPRPRDADAEAAALLQAYFDSGPLPAPVPGAPVRLVTVVQALRDAPALAAELQRIYGLERWDGAAFRRWFLEGALAAWRPGTTVGADASGMTVRSPVCPLLAQASADPRVCQLCQAVQEVLARSAMPGQLGEVRFRELATRGAPACTVRLEGKEAPP